MPCTLQPVVTHLDVMDPDDIESDKAVILDRLQSLVADRVSGATSCQSCQVAEPIFVCSPDGRRRVAEGIDHLRDAIHKNVKCKSDSPQFRLQWSKMLTEDLQAVLQDFLKKHPDEETERRLFHRALEGT